MIIAVTGSISTGKSSVSSYIKKKYPVIDADKLARYILEIDKRAYLDIIKEFGKDILLENREINRKKLGQIIFSDKEKRIILNRITHKEINREFKKRVSCFIKAGEKIIFYDIPLLFEVNLEKEFDAVILVYVPKKIQLERLMKRDSIDMLEALRKINSQINIEDKKKRSKYIIDNSKSLENSFKQFDEIMLSINKNIK